MDSRLGLGSELGLRPTEKEIIFDGGAPRSHQRVSNDPGHGSKLARLVSRSRALGCAASRAPWVYGHPETAPRMRARPACSRKVGAPNPFPPPPRILAAGSSRCISRSISAETMARGTATVAKQHGEFGPSRGEDGRFVDSTCLGPLVREASSPRWKPAFAPPTHWQHYPAADAPVRGSLPFSPGHPPDPATLLSTQRSGRPCLLRDRVS